MVGNLLCWTSWELQMSKNSTVWLSLWQTLQSNSGSKKWKDYQMRWVNWECFVNCWKAGSTTLSQKKIFWDAVRVIALCCISAGSVYLQKSCMKANICSATKMWIGKKEGFCLLPSLNLVHFPTSAGRTIQALKACFDSYPVLSGSIDFDCIYFKKNSNKHVVKCASMHKNANNKKNLLPL